MRKRLPFAILLFIPVYISAHSSDITILLERLDSLIAQEKTLAAQKEQRIKRLRQHEKNLHTPEDRYWFNKQLYEEYYVYNKDSAMVFVDRNLEIAQKMDWQEKVAEWKINKSFLFSVGGLLKESLDELQDIPVGALPPDLQADYYGQAQYLYSHFGQYTESRESELQSKYLHQERLYTDSVVAVIAPGHPQYLWYKGWSLRGTPEAGTIRKELQNLVDSSPLENRLDAMNAYLLAYLCRDNGQEQEYLKYMICSAIADVRSVNRDIASLEELASALFALGDIDHAYTYINYCFQMALAYQNRLRVISTAKVLDTIRMVYRQRDLEQRSRLRSYNVVLTLLLFILLCALLYIYRQMKKLASSRTQLNETNLQLNRHVDELSQAHTQLTEANRQFQQLNTQLKETNDQLRESNYVKEEYIGIVFTLCSGYINKLDELRKNVNRRIRAKQIDEVKTLTDTPTLVQTELKEFYHNFDATFLHIYPNFVNDFNRLLRPEEQIVLREGELLNADLRIYALVRLGINDSVKIAEFLHCSPQTIYNNRSKMRKKAIIPKEKFASAVMSLGRMRQE